MSDSFGSANFGDVPRSPEADGAVPQAAPPLPEPSYPPGSLPPGSALGGGTAALRGSIMDRIGETLGRIEARGTSPEVRDMIGKLRSILDRPAEASQEGGPLE